VKSVLKIGVVCNDDQPVTATAAVERRTVVGEIRRVVFDLPVWILALAALGLTAVRFGLRATGGIRFHLAVVRDPLTETSLPWLYQSPVGYWLAWLVGVESQAALRLFHIALLVVVLIGCAYAIAATVSPLAGRLFVVAWFCSPMSKLNTYTLGVVSDLVTVAGLTLAVIVTGPVTGLAVGVLLGVNHFEQSLIALIAVTVLRVRFRDESWRVMIPMFVGLALGRVILSVYLAAADINPNGRGEFIEVIGIRTLFDGWRGQIPEFVWSCYAIAWLAVLWMIRNLPTRQARTLIAVQVALTVPVIFTYDLTRVYVLITWPIAVLAAIWYSERPDIERVKTWALGVCAAAFFAPYPIITSDGPGIGHWLQEIHSAGLI
jgi:hypothetical protein